MTVLHVLVYQNNKGQGYGDVIELTLWHDEAFPGWYCTCSISVLTSDVLCIFSLSTMADIHVVFFYILCMWLYIHVIVLQQKPINIEHFIFICKIRFCLPLWFFGIPFRVKEVRIWCFDWKQAWSVLDIKLKTKLS